LIEYAMAWALSMMEIIPSVCDKVKDVSKLFNGYFQRVKKGDYV
jgi:hypothetical protein